MKPQPARMEWIKGASGRYIRTAEDRFYISKSADRGEPVYTLADGNKLVVSERGDGALERCKAEAERISGVKSYA